MATKQHDQVRREAAEAGLPPDVHDSALLTGYAAFAERHSKTTHQAKAKPKAKAK
jgi:hypothetical protein